MSLTKNHAVAFPYVKGDSPQDKQRIDLHVHDELRKIEASLKRTSSLLPLAANVEPSEKYIGMVRYALTADWDPLSTGVDGYVYWDGSVWKPLRTKDAADITSGTIATARLGSGTANNTTYLRGDQTWATLPASGDVSGPVSSVDNEIALFSGTGGKTIKRASTTGLLKATSGVIAAAVSGTDYAPATSGTSVLKGDGSGGFSSAVDGTDIYSSAYAIPNANIPNGINNGSQTAQSQAVVSGTAYYITRSNLLLPASSKTGGGMVVGTRFLWRIGLTKTAAGTGTFRLAIYRGTNGSTADTQDVIQTLGTQTAAVDNMVVDVMVTVTTTGGTGAYYWTMVPMNKASSATGFGITTGTGAFFSGTVSSVALNTASLQFGLGFVSNTGTPTITIPFVHGQVFNMT